MALLHFGCRLALDGHSWEKPQPSIQTIFGCAHNHTHHVAPNLCLMRREFDPKNLKSHISEQSCLHPRRGKSLGM